MTTEPTGLRWAGVAAALALCAGAAPAGEQGVESFRFVVYGGVCGNATVHGELVAHMVKFRPELVLVTGDVTASPGDRAGWASFDEAVERLGEGCRFHGCPDAAKPGPMFRHRLGPPREAAGTGAYYSFDYKGVHFLVLNSRLRTARTDPQTQWLADDLAAAQGKPTLVFFYNPIFGGKGRGGHPMGRLYWHPLFVKHKVAAVLSGCQRLYFRTQQDGVPYLVTAGGGGILSRIESRRSLLPTDVLATYHHLMAFTVSPTELRGRVIDREGRTRDEFAIPLARPAPAPKPSPSTAAPAQ